MSRETMLERAWQSSRTPGTVTVASGEIYNGTYGCRFKTPVLGPDDDPGDVAVEVTAAWVEHELAKMVRDERMKPTTGKPDVEHDVVTISEQIVYDLLAEYEARLAFGETAEAILADKGRPRLAEKIESLLCDPSVGNKANRNPETSAEIHRGVATAVAAGRPLVFVLPAFPFKDQNPFRSDLPASQPDLGEVAALIHLHCLSLAINQVFRHDVLWLIVSDGTVYEEIFGVEPGVAAKYLAALRDWRFRLNIEGSIHFIDLKDIVLQQDELMRSTPERSFSVVRARITEILQAARAGSRLEEEIGELTLGMLWNRGWLDAMREHGRDKLWQVHAAVCEKDHRHSPTCAKENLPVESREAADDIWRLATETAVEYAAFNLASRNTRLLNRFMPSAIRATSHAKPGQVAMPHESGVAPWNGLAVFDRRKGNARVRSVPLCELPTVLPESSVRFQLYNSSFGFGFAPRDAIQCYL